MDIIQFFGRFHVLVLHLPIGILLLSALMELQRVWQNKPRNNLLKWVWFWGAMSAIGACILGYMLSLGGGYSADAVFIHKTFGISVAVTSLVCWWYFKRDKQPSKALATVLASGQLFLLFSTGHYGANMTHGETYLVEHAPNAIRIIAGFEPHAEPRPDITSLDQAFVYDDVIAPIFKQRCASCHNDGKQKGELNLANIDGILKGGKTANTLGNGQAANSELYKRITMDSHDKKFMPAEGKEPLSDAQTAAVAWWLNSGAPTTGSLADFDIEKEDANHLSVALGLSAKPGAWPLPANPEIAANVVTELQAQGFVVKQISQDIHYLDIDFSSVNTPLTDKAVAVLLTHKQYIAYLNLVDSQLTDEQLIKLAQLPNLLKLHLQHNPITTLGIESLTALTQLQHLNIYGTKVDDGIMPTLSAMPALKAVYIGATKISESAIAQFNQAHKSNVLVALSSHTQKQATPSSAQQTSE